MKTSVKMALATGALGIVGAVVLVGSSYAERGFGPRFGMMGGHGGMGGPIVQEMLKSVDTNGDGAISQDEINAAVSARLAEFDANKDGALSLDEFEALWADLTKPIAVRAFQFLDPNGDASVTQAELNDRFGSVVAHLDRNNDGVLSLADRPAGPRGPGDGDHWRHHRGPGPWMNDGNGPQQDN